MNHDATMDGGEIREILTTFLEPGRLRNQELSCRKNLGILGELATLAVAHIIN